MEIEETGLQVREVNFNGDTLLAGKDAEGRIWAGVSYVCNGIGFNKNEKDRQIKNVQSDIVLNRGCVKFDAGVFDQNNVTVALMLDFIPLWLAKISITPTMQRNNPQLVKKLIEYQLKAKDVLAQAFIYKNQSNEIQLSTQLESRLMSLENSITQLTRNQNELTNGQKLIYSSIRKALFAPVNTSAWKTEIYNLTKEIAKLQPDKYKSNSYVLSEFYKIMRDTYGFVEEQSLKDYKERHNTTTKIYTIDLIGDNKQYRDIFKNILTDRLNSIKTNADISTASTVSNILQIDQLIQKRNDKSPHGVQTYRYVYKNMLTNRAWKWHTTRYKNVTGKQNVKKSELVGNNEQLQTLFKKTVNKLLVN